MVRINKNSVENPSKEKSAHSQFMCPVSGKIHPVDHIAPDIELKDMQNLFIDDKFIKTEKILGVGGFAAVYLGSYNDEKVALKSFRLSSRSILCYVDINVPSHGHLNPN